MDDDKAGICRIDCFCVYPDNLFLVYIPKQEEEVCIQKAN